MPFFMDLHETTGITDEELAAAHKADIALQEEYGITFLTYWRNKDTGHANCLVEAPNAELANELHRVSHGLEASEVIEVNKAVVEAFIGPINESAAAVNPGTLHTGSSLRIILFTDMVGSTAMTQKLGDEAAMNILESHDVAVRAALQVNGGREVKHTGDGIMASFASVSGSVQCAIEVQQAIRRHNQDKPNEKLLVRIGLCAGEPVEKNQDLFGAAVQLAARICDHAQAEEIRVTDTVQELCRGKGFEFEDSEAVQFKGFEDPIKIATVKW